MDRLKNHINIEAFNKLTKDQLEYLYFKYNSKYTIADKYNVSESKVKSKLKEFKIKTNEDNIPWDYCAVQMGYKDALEMLKDLNSKYYSQRVIAERVSEHVEGVYLISQKAVGQKMKRLGIVSCRNRKKLR